MVTSWPKRLPGPGMSAERIAERIARAVRRAAADHRACGRRSRAGVRGARRGRRRRRRDGPHRGVLLAGQAAGDRLLHHRAVRADAGRARRLDRCRRRPGAVGRSSTRRSASSRSWAATPASAWAAGSAASSTTSTTSRALKIRSLGLGGEVYRRLGATPQTTSPGEILTSLQSGLIDGAEFVGPGTDIALGLYRVANVLLRAGLQQAERHRRMHRLAEGLGRRSISELKAIVSTPARARPPTRSPRWSGSTPRRWRR